MQCVPDVSRLRVDPSVEAQTFPVFDFPQDILAEIIKRLSLRFLGTKPFHKEVLSLRALTREASRDGLLYSYRTMAKLVDDIRSFIATDIADDPHSGQIQIFVNYVQTEEDVCRIRQLIERLNNVSSLIPNQEPLSICLSEEKRHNPPQDPATLSKGNVYGMKDLLCANELQSVTTISMSFLSSRMAKAFGDTVEAGHLKALTNIECRGLQGEAMQQVLAGIDKLRLKSLVLKPFVVYEEGINDLAKAISRPGLTRLVIDMEQPYHDLVAQACVEQKSDVEDLTLCGSPSLLRVMPRVKSLSLSDSSFDAFTRQIEQTDLPELQYLFISPKRLSERIDVPVLTKLLNSDRLSSLVLMFFLGAWSNDDKDNVEFKCALKKRGVDTEDIQWKDNVLVVVFRGNINRMHSVRK